MHVELATISTIFPIRGRPRLVVRPRSEYRMSEQGPRFLANTHTHTHTHTQADLPNVHVFMKLLSALNKKIIISCDAMET